MRTLYDLYRSLPPFRRRKLFPVLLLMLLGALAELVNIGAVLPLLAAIATPARAAELPGYDLFLFVTGGDAPIEDLMVRAVSLLIGATLVSAAVRLLIVRMTQDFVYGIGHELATSIFGRMLRQPYADAIRRDPRELTVVLQKIQLAIAVLQGLMQGSISLVIALAIAVLLVAIVPTVAAIAIAATLFLYLFLNIAVNRRLIANSERLSVAATSRTRAFEEAIGGLRDILLDGSQPVFEDEFRRLDRDFVAFQSSNMFLSSAPRYLVEAAGISLIALFALHLSGRPGGILATLPVLGALALGAQRTMPLLQAAWSGWSHYKGNLQVLRDILALNRIRTLAAIPRSSAGEPFARDIVFDRVGFAYADRGPTLRDISLRIGKGERIGLAGGSGSGKSSLLDLLMGLLDPSEGEVRIDGRRLDESMRSAWQAQLGHVPQTIYLADASIAANIAFGQPADTIDMNRVRAAARTAQLDAFVSGLPQGYATAVGAHGVRLSGGQRQRIAIARALYKHASILILDEATGQLDAATEAAVIDAVAAVEPAITIVIVAHRSSALAHCDRVLRLEGGRLVEGEGDEVISPE